MANIWLNTYSNCNLGDDLFVCLLTQRYPNCTFYMPCHHASPMLQHLDNLVILKRNLFDKILRKLDPAHISSYGVAKKCDIGILLGGSMFMEITGWRDRVAYYHRLLKIIPQYFLIGSNFGPYTSEEFLKKHAALFNEFTDCCFRDSRSYQYFADNGHSRFAPDVVFNLPQQKVQKKKQVIIAPVNLNCKPRLVKFYPEYLCKMHELCRDLLKNGYDVKLIAFCESLGDDDCCEQINSGLDAEVINYSDNMQLILDLFQSAEYVVATRFHAMILGWLDYCKVLPVIYDLKMSNVLEDVNWSGMTVSVEDVSGISYERLLQGAAILDEVQNLQTQAQQQFAVLDTLLGR